MSEIWIVRNMHREHRDGEHSSLNCISKRTVDGVLWEILLHTEASPRNVNQIHLESSELALRPSKNLLFSILPAFSGTAVRMLKSQTVFAEGKKIQIVESVRKSI